MIDRQLSARNPRVRQLAKLATSRKARREQNQLVLDGPRALSTFIAAGGEIVSVFTDDLTRLDPTVLESASNVWELDRRELDRISDAASPQGVLAIGHCRTVSLVTAAAHDLIVVLDGVQDPGNVGAVVRVAAACGVGAVVACVGTADPTAPRAVRASAGTLAMLDVVVGVDVLSALATLSAAGVRVIATAIEGSVTLDQLRDRVGASSTWRSTAIVLGSEGAGLSPGVADLVNDTVALTMKRPVESLNVAVAAGVVLYSLVSGEDL